MIAIQKNEERKKAVLLTFIIYAVLLLLFFLIHWKYVAPTKPLATDVIFADLGNETEGLGNTSPKIKGDPSPAVDNSNSDPASNNENIPNTDESDPDIAPSVTNTKTPTRSTSNASPAITMKKKTTNGNNAEEDNGFSKGNDPKGKGGPGSPDGKEGGTGPSVINGNRSIAKVYKFEEDNLGKATVNAKVRVSPAGIGSFVSLVSRGSTTTAKSYEDAIIRNLNKIRFNTSNEESVVTVQFTFDVN